MDMLEIGFYSAVTVYGLIVTWVLLYRLHRLPAPLVCWANRRLDVAAAAPLLGRAVGILRRRPLSAGIALAALSGIVVPYVTLGAIWSAYVLTFGTVVAVAIAALAEGVGDENASEPDGLFFSKQGHDLVHGSSPYADHDRPLGG